MPESISSGDAGDAVLLELELIEPSLGWRQLDERTGNYGSAASLCSRDACERLGSVRCRIDAHSTAVAAAGNRTGDVHRDQHRRHTGVVLDHADQPPQATT